MSKDETIKKKITTQKVWKKKRGWEKKIIWRDKNFQLEGLIELKIALIKEKK